MAYSASDEHSHTLLSDMAALLKILGLSLWVYLASQGSTIVVSQRPAVSNGTVHINGATPSIGLIDEDFICATMDWWPPSKCDYGTCSWRTASLLNLVSFCLLPSKIFSSSISVAVLVDDDSLLHEFHHYLCQTVHD